MPFGWRSICLAVALVTVVAPARSQTPVALPASVRTRIDSILAEELKKSGIQCEIVFLLANDDELLRRFAETRRKHPISTDHVSLKEAIAIERRLLEPILNAADLVIDTSRMGVHDLRELIGQRVEKRSAARLSLLVESFGFKNGIRYSRSTRYSQRATY